MIKAEDLRVGDLVRINENCSLKEGVISYITEIRTRGIFEKEDFVKLKHFDSDWEFGVWCRNIDPIPLTIEILEKNRFEVGYPEKCYNKFISSPGRKLTRFLSIENWPIEWKVFLNYTDRADYVLLRFVKYVHELQHILWALGADANLKV